jgi:hypothetical protein
MVAAIHPLTPGSPAYALLKVSAVGGLVALRMIMARRSKGDTPADEGPEPEPDPAEPAPHPVSRRKAQRRRRRR